MPYEAKSHQNEKLPGFPSIKLTFWCQIGTLVCLRHLYLFKTYLVYLNLARKKIIKLIFSQKILIVKKLFEIIVSQHKSLFFKCKRHILRYLVIYKKKGYFYLNIGNIFIFSYYAVVALYRVHRDHESP